MTTETTQSAANKSSDNGGLVGASAGTAKKNRAPRTLKPKQPSYTDVRNDAMKLILEDRAELCKALKASVAAEAGDIAAKAKIAQEHAEAI
jgi:hypothetical protein